MKFVLCSILFACAPLFAQEKPASTNTERHVEKLENGLTLVTVERSQLPLTTFALFLGRGSAHDPEQRVGLADFALSLAWMGHGEFDENEVLQALGDIGGDIGAGADLDYSSVRLSCMAGKAAEGLDLMLGALTKPAYQQKTIDRELRELESGIAWEAEDPGSMARDAFAKSVLADHPYGRALRRGKPEDLAGVSPTELTDALDALLRPEDAVLFVVGPTNKKLLAQVRERFGALKSKAGRAAKIAEPEWKGQLSFETVERPDMGQIYLRFGAMGLPAAVPDRAAHLVFAQLMAAGFTSVLVDELRVNRGLIYGMSFGQRWLDHASPFSFATSTSAEKAAEVLQVSFDELRKVRAGELDEERLEAARNTLLVQLAMKTVTGSARAEAEYVGYRQSGDFDAWRKRLDEVRSVTRKQVIAAAQLYDPEGFQVVLVGERKMLDAFDPKQVN